jgi:hypothetical protein
LKETDSGSFLITGTDAFSLSPSRIGRNLIIQIGTGALVHFKAERPGTLTYALPKSALEYLRASPSKDEFLKRLAEVSAQVEVSLKSVDTGSPTENGGIDLIKTA